MSFAALAALLQGQRPFMLLAFRRAGTEYLYTDQSRPMTKTIAGVTGTVWAASAVKPSRIGDAALAARAEVVVTLPISDPFALLMLGGQGYAPVTVTIWRGFHNDVDGEVIVAFGGTVISARPNDSGGTIELVCMTDQAALEHQGLSEVMGKACRHDVYSPGCGLVLADWQDELTVTAIDANARAVQVDLSGSGAPASGYYSGGILSHGGRLVWITDHTDDWLTLANAAPELLADIEALGTGDPYPTILAAPGCPRTAEACQQVFDNYDNYGGFPHMPDDSPFNGRSIV